MHPNIVIDYVTGIFKKGRIIVKNIEEIKKENSEIFNDYAYDGAGTKQLIENRLKNLLNTDSSKANYCIQARILYDHFECASDSISNLENAIDSVLILDAITQHQSKVLAILYDETMKYIRWAEEHPEEVLLNEPEYTEFWDLIKKVKEKSKSFTIMYDPKGFF